MQDLLDVRLVCMGGFDSARASQASRAPVEERKVASQTAHTHNWK